MKKSKKKKLAKKSWKKLLGDKDTMKLIRNVMMMQDYSKRQVKKAFKASVKKFLDEEYLDEEHRSWAEIFGYKKNDTDGDSAVEVVEEDDENDDAAMQTVMELAGKKK